MRLYVISTTWRNSVHEYFLTFSLHNKRNFFRKKFGTNEYPVIVYRSELKKGIETFDKIKNHFIYGLQTIPNIDNKNTIYPDPDVCGFWIRIECQVLVLIIKHYVDQDNLISYENNLTDIFVKMKISKKRSPELNTDFIASVASMNITNNNKKCRVVNDDYPYFADIEELN